MAMPSEAPAPAEQARAPIDRRGKLVLAAGLLVATAAIAWTISHQGWHSGWGFLGVDWPGPYSLIDTRIVTGAAESWAAGYDPLRENPFDPFERPLNYPRAWHLLGALGVREAHANVLGAIFVALFAAGLLLAFERVDLRTGVLLLLFVISPAVLLGVERGNNDLVVFFLLALALALGRRRPLAGFVPILLAAVLKIYPVFALSYGLRERSSRGLRALGASVALFAIYCFVTADDLRAIRLVTEHAYVLSYGVDTTELFLSEMVGLDLPGLGRALLFVALGIAALAWLVARGRPALSTAPTGELDAFRIGASVFCGTFVLASNWDYRLMFLYFVVPQLLAWSEAAESPRDVRLASWVSLFLVFIVVWRTGSTPNPHLAATWVLFAWLAYLFVRSLPRAFSGGRLTPSGGTG